MTPTVHLVDDDASFLKASGRMLRGSGYQVAIHDSALEFLGSLTGDARGCVVADLDMPGLDGLALQRRLERHESRLPVVFLTGRGDIPSSVQAVRAGAEDFLTKNAPRESLLGAIDRALDRNRRETGERDRLATLRVAFSALSAREMEVLGHVVLGRLNKEIASDLVIHERTVKLHRTAITTKTGLRSAAELAVACHEARLFGRAATFPKGQ